MRNGRIGLLDLRVDVHRPDVRRLFRSHLPERLLQRRHLRDALAHPVRGQRRGVRDLRFEPCRHVFAVWLPVRRGRDVRARSTLRQRRLRLQRGELPERLLQRNHLRLAAHDRLVRNDGRFLHHL